MELSINLKYLFPNRDGSRYSVSEAAELVAAAGFRYLDYTPDVMRDDWAAKVGEEIKLLERLGLTVEQTHSPYNRYKTYSPEDFDICRERVFEASKMLGAKYVVIHPDEIGPDTEYDECAMLKANCADLEPWADYCVANNMTLAIETVFEDGTPVVPTYDGKSRFGSRLSELKGIIEAFDSPNVQCCWDSGHAKLAFGDEFMPSLRDLGKYVVCTHIHDNYYDRDLHLIPFLGKTDWEEHMRVFAEIGYKGSLSFELVYGTWPDEMRADWLRLVYKTGMHMTSLFDAAIAKQA